MAKHLGWFGHRNLGDDEMHRLLERHLGDTDTFGGGTLITPGSEFYCQITKDMIGISLGVAESWNGEGIQALGRLRKIYVRDFYSARRLAEFGLDAVVSADLWFLNEPPKPQERTKRVANLITLTASPRPELQDKVVATIKRCRDSGFEFFAMSPIEDKELTPEATLFEEGGELLNYLAQAKQAIVTRLHAYVAAVIAGVPEITYIPYDKKLDDFTERMKDCDLKTTRELLLRHVDDIKKL